MASSPPLTSPSGGSRSSRTSSFSDVAADDTVATVTNPMAGEHVRRSISLKRPSLSSESSFRSTRSLHSPQRGDDNGAPTRSLCRRSRGCAISTTIVALAAVAAVIAVTIFYVTRPPSTLSLPKTMSGSFHVVGTRRSEYQYNGEAVKTEDDAGNVHLEMRTLHQDPNNGLLRVTTVVGNRGYEQWFNSSSDPGAGARPLSSTCLTQRLHVNHSDIPLVFDAASHISDASDVDVDLECGSAPLYALRWGYQDFYYCSPSDGTHKLETDGMRATFVETSNTRTSLHLSTPINATSGQPMNCPVIVADSSMALPPLEGEEHPEKHSHDHDAAHRRLGRRGQDHNRHRRRFEPTLPRPSADEEAIVTESQGPGWSMRHTTFRSLQQAVQEQREAHVHGRRLHVRGCLFVHGTRDDDNAIESYWGTFPTTMDFFDHCPSITELTLDMYNLGWDNQQLATAVCDAKAGNRNNGRSVIFSHGSAGLVVAHALREGLCTFGDDARWYAIGTPWGGMEAADATSVCSYAYGTYSSMFNEIGFCSAGAQSTAVSTLRASYTSDWNDLRSTAASNLRGQMCGKSPTGLMTGAGRYLTDLNQETSLAGDSTNDALTSLSRCRDNSFSATVKTSCCGYNYTPKVNYLDLTCRYDDAFMDLAKQAKPCRFLKDAMAREAHDTVL